MWGAVGPLGQLMYNVRFQYAIPHRRCVFSARLRSSLPAIQSTIKIAIVPPRPISARRDYTHTHLIRGAD